MGNEYSLLLMSASAPGRTSPTIVMTFGQRRNRRVHAEYCFNLELYRAGGKLAVARDNYESMDVALQERLVPVWVAVELLRVA